jgi:hypothetical protein
MLILNRYQPPLNSRFHWDPARNGLFFLCHNYGEHTIYIFFYFIHITLCFIHFGVIETRFNVLNTYFLSLSCIAFQLRQDSVVVYETLHKSLCYYLYLYISNLFLFCSHIQNFTLERPTEEKGRKK